MIERFERINNLISKKGTKKPSVFAQKLNISVSTLYETLKVLKEKGAPIFYDRFKETYYYSEEGKFKIHFEKKYTSI